MAKSRTESFMDSFFKMNLSALLDFTKNISEPVIKQVADGFEANITRTVDTLLLYPFVVYWAMARQRTICQSAYNVKKITDFSNYISHDIDDELSEEAERLNEVWYKERNKNYWPEVEMNVSIVEFAGIVAIAGHGRMESAFKGVLANQIIGLWTAYEALATDLWVALVNSSPMSFGIAALEAKAFTKKSRRVAIHPTEGKKQSQPESKPITIDLLKEFGFNLSDKLGTAIYRSGKFDFNRSEGIQYAYSVVLGQDAIDIFGKYGKDISLLEAIRNLLVHRAGKVDKSFMSRVKAYPELSSLKEGDLLPLTGDAAAKHMGAVTHLAKLLLLVVEKRIAYDKDKETEKDTDK